MWVARDVEAGPMLPIEMNVARLFTAGTGHPIDELHAVVHGCLATVYAYLPRFGVHVFVAHGYLSPVGIVLMAPRRLFVEGYAASIPS